MAKRAASASVVPDASMRVVVLHGSDAYLLRERTRLLAEALEQQFGGLERFQFDGASTDLATVLDELRSYGLMQRHKLVILDNADEFLSRNDGANRPAMEAYVAKPVPEATLLMRADTWRPSNLDKAIAKIGAAIKCEAPAETTAVTWCSKRCANKYDCTIDDDAAALLVHRIGPDLARLDSELQKMAAFVGAGQKITSAIVTEMTQPTREELAWTVQTAMLTGSPAQALAKLGDLLTISRLDPIFLLWAVTDLIRKLHSASRMLAQGESEYDVTRQCKLWPPDGPRILVAGRQGNPDRFAQLLQQAIDTDRRCKSGLGDARRSVEGLTVLVADTIGSASAPRTAQRASA